MTTQTRRRRTLIRGPNCVASTIEDYQQMRPQNKDLKAATSDRSCPFQIKKNGLFYAAHALYRGAICPTRIIFP
eukprot:1159891-Pelagomonas_calceolata.AAC.5